MVWPNILNGDDTPLCLHLLGDKDTTGNDLFFKAKLKESFFRFWKVPHLSSSMVEIWIRGFHLLPIGLLHDSLSDEIGYKTVTFAGYEHSFQAPYRLQEGRKRGQAGKSFTPISGTGGLRLIYRLSCIFFNLFSMYFSVLVISWNTDREVSAEAPERHILYFSH